MAAIAQPTPVPKTDEEHLAAREHFKRHGFVYLKDFFTPEEAEGVRSWVDTLGEKSRAVLKESLASGVSIEKMIEMDEAVPVVVPERVRKDQVCRIEDYVTPALSGPFMQYPDKVRDFMSRMFGEDYLLFKEKINFKWPGGGAFPHHQDYPAYDFLAPRTHATAMLTIDAASTENGCLQVAYDWTQSVSDLAEIDQEALKEGMAVLPYYQGGENNGTIKTEYVDKFNWFEVHSKPTELLIFSSFVPHFSLVNESNKSRRAMFLTHNRAAEGTQRKNYYDAKRSDPKNPMFHVATPTYHNAM
mmetsp:Transcript_13721/g.15766  ORF Transcript_13721/g.15766 Transcript_13721/m.15766 type:complete len:301 (+) Transcript_13721:33-935(+)